MRDIIIACAGSYGKEAYYKVKKINEAAKKENREIPYNIIGFIDDNVRTMNGTEIDLPILGTIDGWDPIGNELYVMGTGNPRSKAEISNLLKSKGCNFISVIRPDSYISGTIKMGEGCAINAYAIGCDVVLGNYVDVHASFIMSGAYLGDYSTTMGFSVVEKAIIGKGVSVGSHAVVKEGVHVGNNVEICAGSIVYEDIPDNVTVIGDPARIWSKKDDV